jgi:hypothetical protein
MALAVFTAPLRAEDVVTEYNSCEINWTRGVITAGAEAGFALALKGTPVDFYDGSDTSINRARMESYHRARETALERLMSAVKIIQVEPERNFRDLVNENIYARKRLSEVLIDLARVRLAPLDFNSAYCEARLGLGDLVTAVPRDFPGHDFPSIDDTPLRTEYSGLIVDCRGLKIEPMIFPSIYNEYGLEIYGRIYAEGRSAARHGLAAYSYSEDEARRHKTAGNKPFYTVALKSLNGCPVISDRDTRRVLSSPQTRNNLKKCRVILILDRKGARGIASRESANAVPPRETP